jgi:hypothetical protein
MNTLTLLHAALFNQAPQLGSSDFTHEVAYRGYKRMPLLAEGQTNITEISFPPSEQDEPVLVTHAAAIDGRGIIVAVHPLPVPEAVTTA